MIRAAVPGDAAAVAAVYAPYVLGSAISFEEEPPTAAEMGRRMASGLPWLVAEEGEGPVVGFAYAAPHRSRPAYRWSVDVSVYVAEPACGRGVGRALYDVLLPLLADLGHVSAYAGVALPNAASVRLHEACGFEAVGVYREVGFKHGRWHDVGWWQRRLREATLPPEEPRRWDETLG